MLIDDPNKVCEHINVGNQAAGNNETGITKRKLTADFSTFLTRFKNFLKALR